MIFPEDSRDFAPVLEYRDGIIGPLDRPDAGHQDQVAMKSPTGIELPLAAHRCQQPVLCTQGSRARPTENSLRTDPIRKLCSGFSV